MAARIITSLAELPPALAARVSPEEKKYIAELKQQNVLPFGVTQHFAALARPAADDPIRRQFFPDPREALPDPFALDDPLGAAQHRAVLPDGGLVPRLIRQYRDRALLLAGGSCAGYCRHCFRRAWLGAAPGFISGRELESALAWLAAHSEVREILVSGGDPLTVDNAALAELFYKLRQARPGILLRVCSRAPVTDPARLSGETLDLFREFLPLRLVAQINHPRELETPPAAAGITAGSTAVSAAERLVACVSAGIPVHVQTVLLKGINDDPAVLAALFRACLDAGLTPYYLFQLDRAAGTAHFRVPLERGLAVYRETAALISGLGLPAYALELPGAGKLRLHENCIAGKKTTAAGQVYLLRDGGGGLWEYPA
jgi:lysine 2,3-aminomutase